MYNQQIQQSGKLEKILVALRTVMLKSGYLLVSK